MKVGVVGCGYWGPNLVRNLIATHRCESVSCYDVSPKALHQLLGRFPFVTPATSLDDMLAHVDAVMLATPVKSHYALARQVLSAGKGVFVEKPLTASYSEAAELVELARGRKLAIMTGHTFLYSPAVRKIQRYIAEGTLGEIFSVSSQRVNLGIHRQDVNVIWDLAPHDLSMLLYWLRESPARVSRWPCLHRPQHRLRFTPPRVPVRRCGLHRSELVSSQQTAPDSNRWQQQDGSLRRHPTQREDQAL